MPRVANPSRANARTTSNPMAAASPLKGPLNMPLNDDAHEKAVRLQSRQALHDLQLNQIRAAASPMRKLNNFNRAASSSPKTPSDSTGRKAKPSEQDEQMIVAGSMISPVKRVPILANFEEWMKMATDNKINATNSWNFALIDYFHDMSLLKEGDGVNFQKASCTLDGCVKIYTSRVDSVATETGKLLSGLAENGSKKRKGGEEGDMEGGEEGEEEGEEEEGEDGVRKRVKKRVQRSSEATLASSFAQLQLKKFDLEFSVDLLFKKASADFDEGGCRGLLLNNLAIDSQGRIVFASSDDTGNDNLGGNSDENTSAFGENQDKVAEQDSKGDKVDDKLSSGQIDIASLRSKFFPDLELLDSQDICPSLKNSNLADPSGVLDIPAMKAPSDWRQDQSQPANLADKSGILLDDNDGAGFDDDDEDALGGFDLPPETGFGEGGEVWARTAVVEAKMPDQQAGLNGSLSKAYNEDGDGMGVGQYNAQTGEYAVSLNRGGGNVDGHDGILTYFDDALRKNWAGPEHWRIRRIKDIAKASVPVSRLRKEKEPFEIDFLSSLDPKLAEAMSTSAASASSISLPKTQWRSKSRNLLPDDKHFNSRQLIHLFLKPKARLGSRQRLLGATSTGRGIYSSQDDIPANGMDEAFWARDGVQAGAAAGEDVQGNYDANFFQDDGLAFPNGLPEDDDDEFADALENIPGGENKGGVEGMADGGDLPGAAGQDGGYGDHLVTQSCRLRPEYVQYARVAKKVDVRRLKEEMWRGMGLEMSAELATTSKPDEALAVPPAETDNGFLKFTTVINNLQGVYPEQAMADISTSYCFICLLHLANEKGLEVAGEEGLTDLQIRKDITADIAGDNG